MQDHATVWRVTTQFRDYGGTIREAPMYFRCLDAAREHLEGLKEHPEEYFVARLEELWVVPPVREGLCATLDQEIEDEYVLKVRLLEIRRSPVRTPPTL